MANRILVEYPAGTRIGTVPAFRAPAVVTRHAVSADLNGMEVGFRWHGEDVSGLIFTASALAALWPGFEPD